MCHLACFQKNTMNIHHIYKCVATGLVMAAWSCSTQPTAVVPTEATSVNETAKIYPDYRDIVVPPNIAPLNVQVKSAGDEYVGCIEGAGHQVLAAAGKDGVLQFDSLEWKQMLNAARGKDLDVTL